MLFRETVGFPGILDDHSDRHRANSSWDRREGSCYLSHTVKIDISLDISIHKRAPNIDDDGSWFHHICRDISWFPDSDDEDICSTSYLCDVWSFTITACDGCSRIDGDEAHGLPDDV